MNVQYILKQIIEINKGYILKLSVTDCNESVILKKQRENRLQILKKKKKKWIWKAKKREGLKQQGMTAVEMEGCCNSGCLLL